MDPNLALVDNGPLGRARNSANTLFGRMAALSIAVFLATQASWVLLETLRPSSRDFKCFARHTRIMLQAVNADAAGANGFAPMSLVALSDRAAATHLHQPSQAPFLELGRYLRANLPEDTQIAIDDAHPPRLWVRFPGKAMWIVTPIDPASHPRYLATAGVMLVVTILLALLAARQMQRPFACMARAARMFGSGARVEHIKAQGPGELCELIRAFNGMMHSLNHMRDDQAMMLAGVVHDLKAPLTRLKLRASLLVAKPEQTDLIRDIDALTEIVQHFLAFTGQAVSAGRPTEVDAFLREQFPLNDNDASQFKLELRAGPEFMLPRTVLDRLVSNLVGNALTHGAAPVEIFTERGAQHWLISVRDHGRGIAEDELPMALLPFVQLGVQPGYDGHYGLGLAIVARLARDLGGRCELSNACGGGLRARLLLPIASVPVLPSGVRTLGNRQ